MGELLQSHADAVNAHPTAFRRADRVQFNAAQNSLGIQSDSGLAAASNAAAPASCMSFIEENFGPAGCGDPADYNLDSRQP